VKFAFIQAEKARWPIEVQCKVFEVSRSGYYAWAGRPASPRAVEDAALIVEIKAAHKTGRGAYGSPRVHRELRAKGRCIGKKRVERLMREEGIELLVTKNSGGPATYAKIEAARRLGVTVVVLRRPTEPNAETATGLSAALAWIKAHRPVP